MHSGSVENIRNLYQRDGVITCGGAELNEQKVQYSEDGKWLFVASGNDTQVYSYASQEVVCILRHHTAKVTGMAVNPLHKMQLFTSSLDGHVALWDYSDGTLLRHMDFGVPLHRFAFRPQKTEPLVFCMLTRTVARNVIVGLHSHLLTERQLGTALHEHVSDAQQCLEVGSGKKPSDFVFTYNGNYLVSYVNKKVLMYNLETDEAYKYDVECTVTSVASHPSQTCIATGNRIGQIHLWYDFGKKESVVVTTVYHWHAHAVADLHFTSDGTYLLSGGEESVLVLWQMATNRKYFRPRLGSPITRVSCAPGDQYFAVCLQSNVIRVVSGLNNDIQFTIGGLRKAFLQDSNALGMKTGLVFCSHSDMIALNSTPGFVQFYNPSSGASMLELDVVGLNYVSRPDEAPLVLTTVEHVAFSPDNGKWMATVEARDDGYTAPELRLKMWRFSEQRQSYCLCACVDPPHEKPITSLAFQPRTACSNEGPWSSHVLVTTSLDGKFKVWALLGGGASPSLIEGEEPVAWACRSVGYYHSLPCYGAEFSEDGSLLAVNYGKYITLWEPTTSALKTVLNSLFQKEEFKCMVFGHHSSSHCVVASTSRHLYVWDLLTCSVLWCVEAIVELLVADPFSSLVAAFVSMTTKADTSKTIHMYLISPLCSSPVAVRERVCRGRVLGAVFVPGPAEKAGGKRSVLYFMDGQQTLHCFGDKDASVGLVPSVKQSSTLNHKTEQAFVEIFGETRNKVNPEQLFPHVESLVSLPNSLQRHQLYDAPPHALPPMSGLCLSFLKSLLPATKSLTSDVGDDLSAGEESRDNEGEESEDDREGRPQEINIAAEVSMDVEQSFERTNLSSQVEAYEWLFIPP